MSEYSGGERTHSPSRSTVSIPYLIVSALLCGVGLFGMSFWLVTQNWLYFAALIPLILGALMLFTRGTGADRA
jgi:hypothetical protein